MIAFKVRTPPAASKSLLAALVNAPAGAAANMVPLDIAPVHPKS